MNSITREHVKYRLINLFKTKMFYDFDVGKMDIHFFNNNIGMQPRHLLYLYFFVENEFEIKIPENCIISGAFCTFNNICDIIFQELNRNSLNEQIS